MWVSQLLHPHLQLRITRTFITNQSTKERKETQRAPWRRIYLENLTLAWIGLLTKNEIYCHHGSCHGAAYPWQASSSYQPQHKITVLWFILILFIPCHIVRWWLLLLLLAVKTNNFHTQSVHIYILYNRIFPTTRFGSRQPSVRILPTIYLIEKVMRPVYIQGVSRL